MKITYICHACFLIEYDGKRIVFDPFCTDETEALAKVPQLKNPDFIVVSHGHDDHIGSLFTFAGEKTTVIGMVEVCSFVAQKGIRKTVGMNMGGTVTFGDISFTCLRADHSSSLDGVYLGNPCSFIVRFGEKTVYFSGDTGIFYDMKLINELYRPEIGIFCAGGRFTADVEQVAYACNRLFTFDTVIPMHYNTFPPIQTDITKLPPLLEKTKAEILLPYQSWEC